MQRELTSIPPLMFVSNGENLVDYRIDGASGGVGDRTENLFNKNNVVKDILQDEGQYMSGVDCVMFVIDVRNVSVISFQTTVGTERCRSTFSVEYPAIGVSYTISGQNTFLNRDGESGKITRSVPVGANYLGVQVFRNSSGYDESIIYSAINSFIACSGTDIGAYEPYGYKIPVTCGGTTTNIYLDEPLEENESISMSDTGLLIPTINGSNTLSIDTTIQPSSVYVKYAANEKSVPARTYLQGVEEMDNWAIYNYINREGSGALKNESTVTPTTVEVGNTIQFNGAASGGTAPYKYWFQYKKSTSSTWTTLGTTYGTAATATLKPGTAVGYNAKITVKDGKGTIKSKIFNVDVTAASTTNNTLTLNKLSFGNADEFTVDNDRAELTVEDNTLEGV